MKKYSDRKLKDSMPDEQKTTPQFGNHSYINALGRYEYPDISRYPSRVHESIRTEYFPTEYRNTYRTKSKLDSRYGSSSPNFGLFTTDYGHLAPDDMWNDFGEKADPIRAESWDRALNWAQDLNDIAIRNSNNKNVKFSIMEDMKTPEGRTYTYRVNPIMSGKPTPKFVRYAGNATRKNMKKSLNEKTKLVKMPKSERSIRQTDKYFC